MLLFSNYAKREIAVYVEPANIREVGKEMSRCHRFGLTRSITYWDWLPNERETEQRDEGRPLLTVETEANGLKEYKWNRSFLGCFVSVQETFILPLYCSGQFSIKYFFFILHIFNLCVPIAQHPGKAVVQGYLSLNMCVSETECGGAESHWLCASKNKIYFRGISAGPFPASSTVYLTTNRGQTLSPWLGALVDSDIWLSYWPARLHRLAGRYHNHMPESTIPPASD